MCNIGVKFDAGRFRLRGVGIIIKDGKVLMVHDEKRKYYYAIGGQYMLAKKLQMLQFGRYMKKVV